MDDKDMQMMREMFENLVMEIKSSETRVMDEIKKINIHLENVTDTNIQLLAEGQDGIVRQLEELKPIAETVEEIKNTVDVMEVVTHKNSLDIHKIKIAK